jgi:hypothetical protein
LARGLPSWAFWSDLGGFARELAGLNIYCLLLSFPGFAVRKKYKNVYISAMSPSLKGKKALQARSKSKKMRVECRDTPGTNGA